MAETRLIGMLRRLCENEVEFILVGGLAAVLHGAPIQTYDVDVVYSREPANIERLLTALDSLAAIFRMQPGRRLRVTQSHLVGRGHLNLLTDYGPLDLLATIDEGSGYGELIGDSVEMDIGTGIRIHVLRLETIISLKERLAGEKDLAMLPILRRTLSETRNKEGW